MNEAEKIAAGLTEAQRQSLLEGCACGPTGLVELGLWEPEFPPEYKQEYFLITPLGLEVRRILERESNGR